MEETREEKKSKRKRKTTTPITPVASRPAYEFTPSTAEDQRVFDDEDTPATRGEFRRMLRLLHEMRKFMQDRMSLQADEIVKIQRILEEARTWATTARVSTVKLKRRH